MENLDYKKLGLRVGIEIHQQLDTNKLFCNCPTILRDDAPHFTVRRELRASAGETEEVDVAAMHETKKAKHFFYEGYNDTTCLVELDEEPPHDLNREALSIVLQVSKMLNARIVDEIEVMRKIVVNGSNTSGFQRTALVASDGTVEVDHKKIGIQTVCVEEEAAKEIEKTDDYTKYRLDRLGIPLIEIATDPDMNTPQEAKIVAEKIGMILRSTGKVKRGLGTIRQDVNVSIKDGVRIEIKGAQDLKLIPLLIENEARRQINLNEIKTELNKRGFKKIIESEKNTNQTIHDITGTLKNTEVAFLKKGIDEGKKVLAMKLEKFEGIIKKEVVKNQRIGFEFGTFAKQLGLGGVIHSDEDLDKYKFSNSEIEAIRKLLDVKKEDAFLMCIGSEQKIKTLFSHYIIPRANHCIESIPQEVRNANPDGTTTYMRPMPGGARMYPETDVSPIKPDTKNIILPELITEKKERIESFGLSNDLANLIAKSGRADEFEGYVKSFPNLKPASIAETMIPKMLELKRKFNVAIEKIGPDDLNGIFSLLNEGKIAKASVETILIELTQGKEIMNIVKEKNLTLLSDAELEKKIREIIKSNEGIEDKFLIGKLMSELKGKAESENIMQALKKVKSKN